MATVNFKYMGIMFEWDDDKYQTVLNARSIPSEEVASVFLDQNHVTIDDTRFDYDEQRFISIGFSNQARLLVIGWMLRNDNIRLITVIEADKSYEKRYNRGY